MPPTGPIFTQLGISLLLGLLVGLQRERGPAPLAGMRTFPLITVLGTVAALLAEKTPAGAWIIAAGFLGVVAVLAVSHWLRLAQGGSGNGDVGTTTDVAALVMYAVGALLVVMPKEVPIAIGGGVAVLLQFKPELHGFARRLGDEDLKSIMQFVLISCIILPILPDQKYGPFNVFNPFETWLLVVLIVGINLGGYIAYKFLGASAGILLGGLLGGAISSTATTVSYSRQARSEPWLVRAATIVIMIASAVVFVRVLVLSAVGTPEYFAAAVPPFAILAGLTLVPAIAAWYRVRNEPGQMPQQKNPTQLRTALFFGVLYVVVLLALAATKEYFFQRFGDGAMYLVAALSGLTDMDAITLSTARLSETDPWIAAHGWRLVLVAAMANLVFKAGMAGALGNPRLLRMVVLFFAIPMAGGLLLLWLL